jgi:mono/diheme cytochrome c family protein
MFVRASVVIAAFLALGTGVLARQGDPEAAKVKNPVAVTPDSIAAGKKIFETICASCHGANGKGLIVSVIEDRGGKQPPDLTDDKWDHGSSDGEIFAVVKKGVGPDYFMAPWDGRINDTDIWSTVNYIRSLAQKK